MKYPDNDLLDPIEEIKGERKEDLSKTYQALTTVKVKREREELLKPSTNNVIETYKLAFQRPKINKLLT